MHLKRMSKHLLDRHQTGCRHSPYQPTVHAAIHMEWYSKSHQGVARILQQTEFSG